MSRLVAIFPTNEEDDVIEYFDGTPKQFAAKHNGFSFDDCHFFKIGDHFDYDGDVMFYWYRTEADKRNNRYVDYFYIGCQSIIVLMFDDGTCIVKRTSDIDLEFHSYGVFEDEDRREDYHPSGCYEELVCFFKELADNDGMLETSSTVIIEEDDVFVV